MSGMTKLVDVSSSIPKDRLRAARIVTLMESSDLHQVFLITHDLLEELNLHYD